MKIVQFEQPCTPDVLQLKYAEVLRRAVDELETALLDYELSLDEVVEEYASIETEAGLLERGRCRVNPGTRVTGCAG